MRKLSLILLFIFITVAVLTPLIMPSQAQATFWCQKPIERAIGQTSFVTFGTNTVNATMFLGTQSTDKICAVDLHIYATPGSCSGNFQVKIYGNDANYLGGGTDGPDVNALKGTSNTVDCNTFVGNSGTFFSSHDNFPGNTNRWSFVSGSPDGSASTADTTTMPQLVDGTKYWLVVTALPGTTGASNVNWVIGTTQRGDATTGRRRAGTSVSALSSTATGVYGAFKFYADYPSGIYFDTTYNCDALGSTSAPYTTTGEPACDDTDITSWFAGSNPCSITSDNPYSLDGPYEQITTAANYPGGAGSKGQRHWLGIQETGNTPANASGGLQLYFQYPGPPEIWLRAYMRYQQGWQWGGTNVSSKTYYPGFFLHKSECNSWFLHCYFGSAIDGPNNQCLHNCQHGNTTGPCNTGGPDCAGQTSCVSLECQSGVGLGMGVYAAEGNHQWNGCIGCLWKDFYPKGTSDDSWHEFEVHEKTNSRCGNVGPGGSYVACNGIFEAWVDGVLIANVTNVDYGYPMKGADGKTPLVCTVGCNPLFPTESPALMGVSNIKMGANGGQWMNYNVQGCHYIDYDDVKVSTDGYIGPISNAIPLAAGRVTNFHVE